MWERSWLYLRKAGTVILGISIVMWFVTSYPRPEYFEVDRAIAAGEQFSEVEAQQLRQSEALRSSAAGRIGKVIEPAIAPLGFDWRLGVAMVGAFAAKEVFVSQMAIVYSLGGDDEEGLQSLSEYIRRDYSPAAGVALILFLLVATPCMATVAVTRREAGSWKFAILQFFGLTAMGYGLAFLAYNIVSLFC